MQQHDADVHEEAIVSREDVTLVSGASGLSAQTDMSEQTAENVLYLVETRAENRSSDRLDLIVVFEEWAWAEWSDTNVVESEVSLVGRIEDYSEKAYLVRGAFEVDMSLVEDRPLEEVEGEYITDLVGQIDETEKDFIDSKGTTYFPKSAVSAIIAVE